MSKVVLKSGREVEYTKPNFFQRAEIKDLAVKYYNEGIPMSLTVCGKIAVHCKIATEQQLNDDEFTDAELYELGASLLEEFYTAEITKKK
jgi:hypothetical protein